MTPPPLTERMLAALETRLHDEVTVLNRPPYGEMYAMMAYHLGWSGDAESRGKRLRPLLTLLSCDSAGGEWEQALPAATAIELIHNFSLIHDDIEDQSATRRGRPTVWNRWGLAQALNIGDAMYTLAFLAMNGLEREALPTERVRTCRRMIEDACLSLTRGQYLDISFETRKSISRATYQRMIGGKTAALLAAAAGAGACLACDSPARIHAFHAFGHHLGLAFQIEDDILGIWGDPQQTGKPCGDDLLHRKLTFPVLIALDESKDFLQLWEQSGTSVEIYLETLESTSARAEAEQTSNYHTSLALESLRNGKPKGEAGQLLVTLAQNLLQRRT